MYYAVLMSLLLTHADDLPGQVAVDRIHPARCVDRHARDGGVTAHHVARVAKRRETLLIFIYFFNTKELLF